jgi:hypothetical protein
MEDNARMNDNFSTAANGETTDRTQLLTLSQAARIAPGAPTPNCVWRWCRRGVMARSGRRIRLEHVRVGGKLFTSVRWLDSFGRRLAEADADYFDNEEVDSSCDPEPEPPKKKERRRVRRSSTEEATESRRARVRAELEAEGL